MSQFVLFHDCFSLFYYYFHCLVSHLQDVDALLRLAKTVSLQVIVYGIAVVEDVCQLVDACRVAAVLRDAEHLCT